MIVPAFSTSRFVKPVVRQIFRDGRTCWLGVTLSGNDFKRVIRTPFARVCKRSQYMKRSKDTGNTSHRTYLIHYILQQKLLVLERQLPRRHNLRLDGHYHDWVLWRTCAVHPVAAGVKLWPHGLDVGSKLNEEVRVGLHHIDGFTGSGRQQSRQSGRESVRWCRDTLVMNNLFGTCAETTSGNNGTSERTNNHINLRRIDILVLRNTTTVASKDTERPGLVQDEAEFVFKFEFNL